MNRLLAFVIAAGWLSIGVAALFPAPGNSGIVYAADPQTASTKIVPTKIMPLGDSITYGTPDPDYGGYRRFLGKLLTDDGYNFAFVGSMQSGYSIVPGSANEGHPGWTIPQIRDAIDKQGWLETYKPDLILLHIGTNDLGLGLAASAPGNLAALLDDILMRLPRARVIVAQIISTQRGPDQLRQSFNDALVRIAASKGPQVSTVDMKDILSASDFADNLHPAASGYDKMARAWEAAIRHSGAAIQHSAVQK